ncbi:MAG: DNA helicase [Tomitella sp.]|nr:DNA helicase [Tomitella sp.]
MQVSEPTTPGGNGDDLDPQDPDDIVGSIASDTEALLLCALLYASNEQTRKIATVIESADFYRPAYGELFAVARELAGAGRPHDAPMILAELGRTGRLHTVEGETLRRALTDVTLVGAAPEAASGYADAVLGQAYRRSYRAAAESLLTAAEQLPEADLFDHLLTVGRAQRSAWNRLQAFRERR